MDLLCFRIIVLNYFIFSTTLEIILSLHLQLKPRSAGNCSRNSTKKQNPRGGAIKASSSSPPFPALGLNYWVFFPQVILIVSAANLHGLLSPWRLAIGVSLLHPQCSDLWALDIASHFSVLARSLLIELHPACLGKSVISIKLCYAFTSSFIREVRLSRLFFLLSNSNTTKIIKNRAEVYGSS